MAQDEMTHSINLIQKRHQYLEEENEKLSKELEISKSIIKRMDRRREGLLRLAEHLQKAWTPSNPNETEEMEAKNNPEKFDEKIYNFVNDVKKDTAYWEQRDKLVEKTIQDETTAALEKEKNFLKPKR